MSVNPGFGGQTFIHSSLKKIELLSKIRESRQLGFRIEVDGGIHKHLGRGDCLLLAGSGGSGNRLAFLSVLC
jgi:hypothetical protein